jgi:hypothetical protein
MMDLLQVSWFLASWSLDLLVTWSLGLLSSASLSCHIPYFALVPFVFWSLGPLVPRSNFCFPAMAILLSVVLLVSL